MSFSEYKNYTRTAIDSVDDRDVESFIELLMDAWRRDATIYVIGNGGSAANASHLAQDLAKDQYRFPIVHGGKAVLQPVVDSVPSNF